jgi:hypothetical protein
LVEPHDLPNASRVGEPLRHVAEFQGQWVALLA